MASGMGDWFRGSRSAGVLLVDSMGILGVGV